MDLLFPASQGNSEMVEMILAAKPSAARARCEDGDTALHAAAGQGHLRIVKALVAAGADVRATTKEGKTPLSMALQSGHSEVAAALRGALHALPLCPSSAPLSFHTSRWPCTAKLD